MGVAARSRFFAVTHEINSFCSLAKSMSDKLNESTVEAPCGASLPIPRCSQSPNVNIRMVRRRPTSGWIRPTSMDIVDSLTFPRQEDAPRIMWGEQRVTRGLEQKRGILLPKLQVHTLFGEPVRNVYPRMPKYCLMIRNHWT